MNSDRCGIKLIDLMAILLIIGIIFGIILPAMNAAREEGRRTQCQNNMRQIGLGLIGFSNQKNFFPAAGTFFDDPAVHGGDPTKSNIFRAINDPASFAGDPSPLRSNWVVEISPYLDNQGLYNAWNRERSYLNTQPNGPSDDPKARGLEMPGNAQVAEAPIGTLRCPDDPTTQPGLGNLSYAANGGFSRWHAIPVGWSGGGQDGQSKNGPVLRWIGPGETWQDNQEICRKLGVMFLGTHTGDQPWDIKTTPSDITDGANSTVLLGENTLVGYSRGTAYSGGLPTNWACPLPNFCMFLASDDICRSPRAENDCLGGQLNRTEYGGKSGEGWRRANRPGAPESINFGRDLTVEGSFPFANSGHPGGANFVFCDGAVRFLSETIDGKVYARIITPADQRLPKPIRLAPIGQNAFGDY